MRTIGHSDLNVFPLCLGGNVFGRQSDEQTSFAVLDAYAAGGGNFVDTADLYAEGRSETLIGEWMASRGNRESVVIATKVGAAPGRKGLKAATINAGVEESLRRLGTDYIDLYYTHVDDPDIPVEEIVGALDQLVGKGYVRYVGASNISPARLRESVEFADREGMARYVVLQQHYNLVERDQYEGALADVVKAHGLSSAPYFALALGFLTGKYRPGVAVESTRADRAGAYLDTERGPKVLAALDEVAAAHDCQPASVALAWLAAQPTVVSPIASARTVEQLPVLLASVDLELTGEDLARLSAASE
jgi:aryl-alcohol dehydrogenase-like predicted oxidoreductase